MCWYYRKIFNFYYNTKNETNETCPYCLKEEIMEDLVESILDYVRSDYTDYAIMINGEWGSRKNPFLE